MTNKDLKKLNRDLRKAAVVLKPPEDLTLSEWADTYRFLSYSSAEGGNRFRTDRTPYMREPMNAFTDPNVREVFAVSPAQNGKSELLLNAIGYIIDQDPGPIMYVQPSEDAAERFSETRIAPMLECCPTIKKKMAGYGTLGRKSKQTKLNKSFPGGFLVMNGSRSATNLSSQPIRYLLGDELDRWAKSAGDDGDPWELAKARTTTFYNDKHLAVSTPTVTGRSKIIDLFNTGTREYWNHQCPHCGAWHFINFQDIVFDKKALLVDGKRQWKVSDIYYTCPECGAVSTEQQMRQAPQKWIATNPGAYERGRKSYWLSAFASPWVPWEDIVYTFLEAGHDPQKLQTFYNLTLGQPFEERGDIGTEETFLNRREDYGTTPDGRKVEVPRGVILLTCGVDTQNDRFEYEVVGHGLYGETWGIKYGVFMGDPAMPENWDALDQLKARPFYDYDGHPFYIRLMFLDSGGGRTSSVYQNIIPRQSAGILAIKGQGGEGVPYVPDRPHLMSNGVQLVNIGTDEGKGTIYGSLRVQTPGPKYCHFPTNPEAGYDDVYFHGLLSERQELSKTGKVTWVPRYEHIRNEPLDCRNYAMAAFRSGCYDMERERERIYQVERPVTSAQTTNQPRRQRPNGAADLYEDSWAYENDWI